MLSEEWISRLAGVEAEPLFDLSGPPASHLETGYVDPESRRQIESLTGGHDIGLQLLASAAVRIVLFRLTGTARHALTLAAPGSAQEEIVLSSPIRAETAVAEFLPALHEELEAVAPHAASDRAVAIERLRVVGSPAHRAWGQIVVSTDAAPARPGTVTVAVEEHGKGLSITTRHIGDHAPLAATSLAPCVASALASLARDPRQQSADVDILGSVQRTRLSDFAQFPAVADHPAESLVDVMDAALSERPAVTDGTTTWTHRELSEKSRHAAALLAHKHSIGPGDRVALLMPRGPELVLAIMAILRAGASYVPLDPDHPDSRVERQLRLSETALVVSSRPPLLNRVTHLSPADLARAPETESAPHAPKPDDEAILFFTSGSTGDPRPVALSHRQLSHKARASVDHIGFDADSRCALLSAISSDATTYQIFAMLAAGGCLVSVGAPDQLDPYEFWDCVDRHGINVINCVPSLLTALVEALPANAARSLRHCLLGGDEIPAGLLPRLADRLQVDTFANLYGPTEATVEAVSFVSDADWTDLSIVPIGRPSPGFAVVLLTPDEEHTPVGVPGEIVILGPSVALGYLDDQPTGPGRFVPLQRHPTTPAFRTGDFGRWRADGNMDFLGRRDNQVKIFGNRVEPAEVVAAVSAIEGVDDASVVVDTDRGASPRLIAAYTATGSVSPTPEDIRAHLAVTLPRHMVPNQSVRLEKLPLTAHGKIDRRAILAHAAMVEDTVWEPTDTAEHQVYAGWTSVLGQPPTSADQNFILAGGHSLTAMALTRELCTEVGTGAITVREVLAGPTPAQLAAVLRTRAATPRDDSALDYGAAPDSGRHSASHAQRRMWFLEQYEEGDIRPFNMVEAFRVDHGPTGAQMRAALTEVVRRHHALRTVFELDDDRLFQVVRASADTEIRFDTHHVDASDVDNHLRSLRETEERHRFDLGTGPLLRATWITTGDDAPGVLLCNLHHSVGDGWSYAVILRDLFAALDGDLDSASTPVQYSQHTARLAQRQNTEVGQNSRQWWRDQLADLPETELPLDRPRPATRSSRGATVSVTLDATTASRLRLLCAEQGSTPFGGIISALRVLAHHLGAGEDLALGSVTAGRDDPALADAVGLYANTVVLRHRFDPSESFRALLTQEARWREESYRHQDHPFDLVVEDVNVERTAGRNPIFDILVSATVSGTSPLPTTSDLEVEHVRSEHAVADFDLAVELEEGTTHGRNSGDLGLSLTFRRDVLDTETVRRWSDQLVTLLRAFVAEPDTPVVTVSSLSEREQEYLLHTLNPTVGPAAERTLLDCFSASVRDRSADPAVICGSRRLSYRELDERSTALARRVAATTDGGTDRHIAVLCDRTERMMVALLAILKTGSAFVPIDPDQPPARRDAILASCGVDAVISDRDLDLLVPVIHPDVLEAPVPRPLPGARPRSLAYVMHTSGSTGEPKGVAVEHRSIVNTVEALVDYYGLGPEDTVLQVANLHFDTAVSEIFTALTAGASIVVIGWDELLDPDAVAAAIQDHGVTQMIAVPSLYQLLLDRVPHALRLVRRIISAGERLSESLVRRHFATLPHTQLFNEYGPAEDSVCTTVSRIEPNGDIFIGRPLRGKGVDLLDEEGRLVPIGVAGEICVSGAGLARGYVGAPALTSARFVPHPWREGTRMYRTGDRAVRGSDGHLVFLGRIDDQVKIRGQRVEPGEVGAVAARLPEVRDAAVIAVDGPDMAPRLVAYVVGDASAETVRGHLRAHLPGHMVPEAVVSLEYLPITSNGKLDRAALPSPPTPEALETGVAMSEAERRIADLWEETLRTPVTDREANFFELGGHSLTAARIGHRLDIPIRVIMQNQTVRELARAVAEPRESSSEVTSSALTSAPDPVSATPAGLMALTPTQRGIWLGDQTSRSGTFTVADLVRVHRRLDVDALRRALEEVVERHPPLRSLPRLRDGQLGMEKLDRLDPLPFVIHELSDADPEGPDVANALSQARAVELDLAHGPLFELRLLRGPRGGDILTVTVHHLVFDGASLDVFLTELLEAHDSIQAGRAPNLAKLAVTVEDWVDAENAWLSGDEAAKSRAYWEEELRDSPPLLDLIDPSRRGRSRGDTGFVRRRIPWNQFDFAGTTPYAVMVTAFATLIHRQSAATDLMFGFPASQRHDLATDALIGCLVNAVPLRLRLREDMTLGDVLSYASGRVWEAAEHSRLPFEETVRHLRLRAAPGRSVGFDFGVTWENTALDSQRYWTEDLIPDPLGARNDLWLYSSRQGDQLALDLAFDTAVIEPDEARTLAEHLRVIIDDVCYHPHTPLSAGAPVATPTTTWSETHYDF